MFLLFSVSIEDYIAKVSAHVAFEACQNRACIGIEIVNDTYVEEIETLLQLWRSQACMTGSHLTQ